MSGAGLYVYSRVEPEFSGTMAIYVLDVNRGEQVGATTHTFCSGAEAHGAAGSSRPITFPSESLSRA